MIHDISKPAFKYFGFTTFYRIQRQDEEKHTTKIPAWGAQATLIGENHP
jgi:hypothetical protein